MTIDAPARLQRGLTLLEMLVVLLIASMAIAIGFQSLGQWRRANEAITRVNGAIQQTSLTEAWFESSVSSLIPVDKHPFKGSSQRLVGTLTQSVQFHQGGAIDASWAIGTDAGQAVLTVTEDGKPLALPLANVQSAQFAYLDKDGKLHEQWPPRLGLHANLPETVLLELNMDDGRTQWWAGTIGGARNPYFNPFEPSLEN